MSPSGRNPCGGNKWILLSGCEHHKLKKAAAAAKEKALAAFRKRYPTADMGQFTTEVEFDEKNNSTGEVEFMAGPAWLQNPNEVGENNWSRAMRIALGFGNFHY